jgi:omega-hydroxy-beta-dihydromenaquinone-9 sulfotransferase
MDWRLRMLEVCGPGVLSGIRLEDWLRLLRKYWREVDLSRVPRVCAITLQSFKNSTVGAVERRRFGSAVEKVVIQPPLFVLGHWRSGTTLLHELLSQDDRFAYPTSYQTSFPHIFLTFEALDSWLMKPFMPSRRPMDNMGLSLASPQEDEFALCSTSLKSSCMQWVFPSHRDEFRKFLTFKAAGPAEITSWQQAFLTFIKKLQWHYQRPLLLKSPQHTARIRLLLDLFPEAKFVHIHRDPFRVFQSSRQTFQIMFTWHGLQRPELESLDDWIIEQYREMYEAFFEQQPLIPSGRFHEVSFEELERDPVEQVRELYRALDLPDFRALEPKLRSYVGSLAGYRKNQFSDLSLELKQRLRHEWVVSFEKWGYPSQASPAAELHQA